MLHTHYKLIKLEFYILMKQELKITFDQETAFKDKQLSFINIYHPIIQAGVIMYEKNISTLEEYYGKVQILPDSYNE